MAVLCSISVGANSLRARMTPLKVEATYEFVSILLRRQKYVTYICEVSDTAADEQDLAFRMHGRA